MNKYPPIPSRSPNTTQQQATSITFVWLLHLRWGAIFSQIVLIYMVGIFFQIDIPVPLVSAIIGFEIVSNLTFFYSKKRQFEIKEWVFGAIMFIDVILLTILLFKTGGAMNPFTFLYLLHAVIGAVLMRPLLAWSLGIFTILCYSTLFLPPEYVGFLNDAGGEHEITGTVCVDVATMSNANASHMQLHLQGMLVAFAITTIFIVFFIGRIRKSLENHYETVEQLQDEMVKNEKLAALATLAAGAAHEFSTPLSTIAVAAGEMLHYCNKHDDVDDELVDDVYLIKDQVASCKEILDQLTADSGSCHGEQLTQFTTLDLREDIEEAIALPVGVELVSSSSTDALQLNAPYLTIMRTIKGLIKNAIDATPTGEEKQINLNFSADDTFLNVTVKDQGEGMSAETTHRATEPFFTTKSPGKGMGLGLFLTNLIAERFGGDLNFESSTGLGTKVRLRLALKELGCR